MDEFQKLTWRKTVADEDLQEFFLSEKAVASTYVYKSFTKSIKSQPKKKVKLHIAKEKYVPGLKYYRLIMRRSLLTKTQKSHCLEALKVLQSGKTQNLLSQREKVWLKIYSECQPKILEENRLFQQYIKNIWLKYKEKPTKVPPGIYNFVWPRWKKKISRYLDYPQFYKEINSFCLNFDENEAFVDFTHLGQPLETGTLARFTHPNLKEQCCLRFNTLQKVPKETPLYSKLSVSQDENLTKILQTHNFDVAISSSALKQIIDYTDTKNKWMIPIVIKEINIGDTKTKKVVFIDKVLPKVDPSAQDLKQYIYKRLLKLTFCQYEAFKYPVVENPIENLAEEDEEISEETEPKNTKMIHHNVNYRIWNVKKTTPHNTLMKNQEKDSQITLLVRCKLDACEGTEPEVLHPVVVRPKIEQQAQYGANIPSKSELARDWASLFFRLYTNLYRARIYSPMNDIISVERCSLQKINTEAHTHYEYKPMLGLGVLEKVFNQLLKLECGNYLLQHLPKNEAFLSVMKQVEENTENAYDLYAECENTRVDFEKRQNWLPIDVNYILPPHEEHKQIPAVFHGFDSPKNANQVPKKRGKQKRKKQ